MKKVFLISLLLLAVWLAVLPWVYLSPMAAIGATLFIVAAASFSAGLLAEVLND